MDKRTFVMLLIIVALSTGLLVELLGQSVAQTPPPIPRVQTFTPPQNMIQLVALTTDTFAAVKDHGDSQTVLIYQLDAGGKVKLRHKVKFFY